MNNYKNLKQVEIQTIGGFISDGNDGINFVPKETETFTKHCLVNSNKTLMYDLDKTKCFKMISVLDNKKIQIAQKNLFKINRGDILLHGVSDINFKNLDDETVEMLKNRADQAQLHFLKLQLKLAIENLVEKTQELNSNFLVKRR